MILIDIPTEKLKQFRDLTNEKNINFKVMETKEDGTITTIRVTRQQNFEMVQTIAASL